MQHIHVYHHVPLERDREENHRAAPIADPSTADCDANGDSDATADPAAHLDINESANSDAQPHGHTNGDIYANCHTDRDGKCYTITVAQRSAYRYAAGLADPAACSGPDNHCHGGRDAPPSARRNCRTNRFTGGAPHGLSRCIRTQHAGRHDRRISHRRRLGWRDRAGCGDAADAS